MRRVAAWLVTIAPALIAPAPAPADEFDRLDGPALMRLLKGPDAASRPSLDIAAIGSMPAWLRDSRSALVLARTGAGNPARLLLVPELRKPADGGGGEPIPVLVVERLDTFDAGDPSTRLASRRDVVLFDGMPLDLDTGQVVPPGQGGDLVFRVGEAGASRLEPIAPAALFALGRAPTLDAAAAPRPSPGRAILPGDCAGRFRLFSNGQWSGTLDLAVGPRGVVTGSFRSDLHGTAYAVTGQVVGAEPGRVRFAVALPRARQEFDGYLFGEGKGAIAGTVALLDRTFGFFAVRDGGRYAPDGRDLGPLQAPDADRPGRVTVDLGADGSVRVDGKPVALDHFADALRPLADPAAEVPAWVLITARPAATLADLAPVVAAVRAGGIATIRVEAAGPAVSRP